MSHGYTYKQTEHCLWTVGFHDPQGHWQPESDHGSTHEAAARTRWLNGGRDEPSETTGTATTTETGPFDEWCILELMGHRRLAGRVREVQLAGAGMLRLDMPATDGHGPQTQYINPTSVYALHPTTEDIATAAAGRFRPEPVSRWELEPRKPDLPGPDPGWDNGDDPDDDPDDGPNEPAF